MKYLELAEKKSHGTPDLPVEYYHIDKTHPRYFMQAHWHREFELIRVLSGKISIYLNNVPYELRAGECLIVEGGCLKKGDPEGESVYECLVFDPAMLRRRRMTDGEHALFDNPLSDISIKNLIDPIDAALSRVIDELFQTASERAEHYELKLIGLLFQLFFELKAEGYILDKRTAPTDKAIGTVMSLLDWIDDHLTEQITLSALASAADLSEKYVCRIFKLYTSKTPFEFINEKRIERAALDLPYKTVTEAAFSAGFNDQSYFCKLFKRYMGVTPSEYKKSLHAAHGDNADGKEPSAEKAE